MAALVMAATLGAAASPALAQDNTGTDDPPVDSSGGQVGDGEYEASVRYGWERGSIGSADNPCEFEVHDYLGYQHWWRGWTGQVEDGPLQEDGDADPQGNFDQPWVAISCIDAAGFISFVDGFQLGEPPPLAILVEHARRSLRIPLPSAGFSPDPSTGAVQVVGLQTWVWVDSASSSDQTATACIPEVGPAFACATIDATFVDSGWNMGDTSDELICGGPGRAYDTAVPYAIQEELDHCYHVYLRAGLGGSTYPVVATTFWHVAWRCLYDSGATGVLTTPCGGGDLGIVGRSEAPTTLDVIELQARATSPG